MLTLSPSKIRAYQKCPLQYQLQAENSGGPGPSSPELAIDRVLHDTLERFSQALLRGKNPTADELVEVLRGLWKPEAGDEQAIELASQRMRRFYAVQMASSSKIVAGKSFPSRMFGELKLNTVVDRIDRLPGGALELIDFKSGKPPREPQDIKRDLPALLAFMAASSDAKTKRLGEPLQFTYWYIQSQERQSAVFDAEDFAWAERTLMDTAEGVSMGFFPARKGPQCGYCEQQARCPAWPQTPLQISGEDADTFGRRLRASYSKLSMYKNCPRSYSKSYVERVPSQPKPFFDLGTTVHEALEEFHGADYKGAETEEALLGLYDAAFAKHQRGYRSEEEKAKYYEKGRAMLAAYHKSFVAKAGRAIAYKVEEYFEYPLGKNVVLNGFIDRIDREGDRLVVWDYKTEVNQRTQEEVDQDLQLGIYAWACKRLFGQDVDLGLFMMTHDQAIRSRRTPEQLLQIEGEVDELAGRILEDTQFQPKLNKHCPDCDFLADCPLRPEVEQKVAAGELKPAGF